jgi:predicted nuclease with TOPRIM domain
MTTNPQETSPQSSDNRFDRVETTLSSLSDKLDKLATDQEKFNDRFSNYQQATQWVVQLAFSLIASATVIVIITNIFKR